MTINSDSASSDLTNAIIKAGIAGLLLQFFYIANYWERFSENPVWTLPCMTVLIGLTISLKEKRIQPFWLANICSLFFALMVPLLVGSIAP
tara:strand:- start:1650 stop:1922 length:273 start_codon:yes stop_codon:yes gene_type:complete